jgi:hypothetical protein
MSATLANLNQVAGWLNAVPYESTWRPVKLTEYLVRLPDGHSTTANNNNNNNSNKTKPNGPRQTELTPPPPPAVTVETVFSFPKVCHLPPLHFLS